MGFNSYTALVSAIIFFASFEFAHSKEIHEERLAKDAQVKGGRRLDPEPTPPYYTFPPAMQPSDPPVVVRVSKSSVEAPIFTFPPAMQPTFAPAPKLSPRFVFPSSFPSSLPSELPSGLPSGSALPSTIPSELPSLLPSAIPSEIPSDLPSSLPSELPSDLPSDLPSSLPSELPSDLPSSTPTSKVGMMSKPEDTVRRLGGKRVRAGAL